MQNRHRKEFGIYLNELSLFGNGIEIGVAEGNYSEVLIKTSKLSKLYLLDTWEKYDPLRLDEIDTSNTFRKPNGDIRYRHVLKKMKVYGDRVEVIRGDSREEYKRFEDNYFDFIYIDANHGYEFIKQDLINWYPKCKIGGVFSGHDYVNAMTSFGMCGVKMAVDEFCEVINRKPIITFGTEKCPPSWCWVK